MRLPSLVVTTFVGLTYVISPVALALDVNDYEQLVRLSESKDPTTASKASIAVDAYFAGIAHTIQLAQTGSQTFRVGKHGMLCFPSQIKLTPELVRGVLDVELKNPKLLGKALGPKWRELQLPFVVVLPLTRLFPCPHE
jgi:hypothetical protein